MNQIEKIAKQIQRLIQLMPWTLSLLWQSHSKATIGLSLLTLCLSFIPIAQLWITKLLVDQVVYILTLPGSMSHEEALQRIFLYIGAEAAVLFISILIGLWSGHTRNILQEHLVYHIQLKVLSQSARLDLAMYESPTYYDQMQRAQQQARSGPIRLLDAILTLSEVTLTLLFMSTLLFLYKPWVIIVLTLSTVPSFIAMMYYGQKRFMVFNNRTPEGRVAEYLSNVLSRQNYAKEVRIWGITTYLMDRIKTLRGKFKQENIDLSRGQAIASLGGEMLSIVGYYIAYVTVVISVVAGQLTVGDLTLYGGLFSRSQSLFEDILRALANVYEIQLFAEQLDIFLKLEPTIIQPAVTSPPPPLHKGLSVENLSFTYPETDKIVLKDINFTISPGECVALVGANGAGKTTLIKCLLRLYDIDSGTIWADDYDLRELDPTQWRNQVTVVFQDYVRYELTAQENIGFGNLAALNNMTCIQQAAQEAGIDGVLSHLPNGYQTMLGRTFAGGHELSLGQWQRVAIARALIRQAPLLILDEPTAAMDAQAEYNLFKQFQELAKGRMTLLISHRFSTVRMADRILVLDKGVIIEDGTHNELMAQGGKYAHLFKLQADKYQLSSANRVVAM